MYCAAPSKLSSDTSPPCLWNCGTAAGEVLKIRQGAVPAVIAAPITSSEVSPAGISCAVTNWPGCAAFHSFTIALPQAISSGLLDIHTLMGPVAVVAPEESLEPPPHAAVIPTASIVTVAAMTLFFIVSPFAGDLLRDVLGFSLLCSWSSPARSSRGPRAGVARARPSAAGGPR